MSEFTPRVGAIDGCEAARERIQMALDGALDRDGRRVLEAHAERCAGCARALQEATALGAVLSEWVRIEPSPRFVERVMSVLGERRRTSAALAARSMLVASGIAAAITAVLIAAPTRRVVAQLLVEGTDRGATGALVMARTLTLLVACATPLAQTAAASLAPVFAVARAAFVAAQHVSLATGGYAAAALVLLLLIAAVRRLAFSRERRGFHVLVL